MACGSNEELVTPAVYSALKDRAKFTGPFRELISSEEEGNIRLAFRRIAMADCSRVLYQGPLRRVSELVEGFKC